MPLVEGCYAAPFVSAAGIGSSSKMRSAIIFELADVATPQVAAATRRARRETREAKAVGPLRGTIEELLIGDHAQAAGFALIAPGPPRPLRRQRPSSVVVPSSEDCMCFTDLT
jgi:hypothetical protein